MLRTGGTEPAGSKMVWHHSRPRGAVILSPRMEDPAAMLVIGILPTPGDVALCLDNLAEAEYSPKDISLVMRSRQDVEKLAAVSGALTGLALGALPVRLSELGLSSQEVAGYQNSVLSGGAIVAVEAPTGSEDAAAEIIADAHGRDIRVLREG
jgi:hypothetical protein